MAGDEPGGLDAEPPEHLEQPRAADLAGEQAARDVVGRILAAVAAEPACDGIDVDAEAAENFLGHRWCSSRFRTAGAAKSVPDKVRNANSSTYFFWARPQNPRAGNELLQTRDVGRRTDIVVGTRSHPLLGARGLGRRLGDLRRSRTAHSQSRCSSPPQRPEGRWQCRRSRPKRPRAWSLLEVDDASHTFQTRRPRTHPRSPHPPHRDTHISLHFGRSNMPLIRRMPVKSTRFRA